MRLPAFELELPAWAGGRLCMMHAVRRRRGRGHAAPAVPAHDRHRCACRPPMVGGRRVCAVCLRLHRAGCERMAWGATRAHAPAAPCRLMAHGPPGCPRCTPPHSSGGAAIAPPRASRASALHLRARARARARAHTHVCVCVCVCAAPPFPSHHDSDTVCAWP